MNSFCKVCGNLLDIEVTSGGEIFLICTNDLLKHDATDENTLIDGDNMQSTDSMEKFENFLKSAAFDPTNKKVKNKCSKCNNMIVTLVRITSKETVVYVCDCGNLWT